MRNIKYCIVRTDVYTTSLPIINPKGGNAGRQDFLAQVLYNSLIWRVLKLAFFFKKVFSLYLFWRLEQSEQRHLYLDIFLCDL